MSTNPHTQHQHQHQHQHHPAQTQTHDLHSRPANRAAHTLRALHLTFDGLARVDGSARFSFGAGGPGALASLSGPVEVRLAAEHPAQATFEVLLRPLANVPATEAKALAAVVRGALAPGLLLAHNPRTLVQLVVQVLVPAPGHGKGHGQRDGEGRRDGIVAAVINAGTLALLNAGSVPMRGVVCAVAVGKRKVDGVVVVDPEESEELVASGCFAYLMGDGEERAVWMSWKAVSGGTVDEEGLERAKVLARATVAEVYEAMGKAVERMGRTTVLFTFGEGEKGKVDVVGEDGDSDDGKMEI